MFDVTPPSPSPGRRLADGGPDMIQVLTPEGERLDTAPPECLEIVDALTADDLRSCHRDLVLLRPFAAEAPALPAEGQRFSAETLRLLSAVDAFRSSSDDIHRRMGGRLDVAVFDKTASNPAAHIGDAIALFASQAPEVSLQMHVASIPAIERGVFRIAPTRK